MVISLILLHSHGFKDSCSIERLKENVPRSKETSIIDELSYKRNNPDELCKPIKFNISTMLSTQTF